MTESREISATVESTALSSNDLVFSPNSMQQMQDVANVMSQGHATVPQHLQKKPADCLAVVMQAASWNMSPFVVAQKTHLVNGTLGYEAQLVNAVITSSNAIDGRFHYRYSDSFENDKDPNAWVQVGAIIRGEQEIQWGERLYPATVQVKNSPLWKSNPKQQSAYLALKYWARMYAPHVILGVYTPDELREETKEKEVEGETIRSMMKEARQETAEEESKLDSFEEEAPATEIQYEDVDKLVEDISRAESIEALKLLVDRCQKVEPKYLDMVRSAYNSKGKMLKGNNKAPLEAEISTEKESSDDWINEYSEDVDEY